MQSLVCFSSGDSGVGMGTLPGREMGYEERSLGHNWRGGEVPLAIIPLTQPGRCQLVQLLHHMKTKSDTGNGDFILLFWLFWITRALRRKRTSRGSDRTISTGCEETHHTPRLELNIPGAVSGLYTFVKILEWNCGKITSSPEFQVCKGMMLPLTLLSC